MWGCASERAAAGCTGAGGGRAGEVLEEREGGGAAARERSKLQACHRALPSHRPPHPAPPPPPRPAGSPARPQTAAREALASSRQSSPPHGRPVRRAAQGAGSVMPAHMSKQARNRQAAHALRPGLPACAARLPNAAVAAAHAPRANQRPQLDLGQLVRPHGQERSQRQRRIHRGLQAGAEVRVRTAQRRGVAVARECGEPWRSHTRPHQPAAACAHLLCWRQRRAAA